MSRLCSASFPDAGRGEGKATPGRQRRPSQAGRTRGQTEEMAEEEREPTSGALFFQSWPRGQHLAEFLDPEFCILGAHGSGRRVLAAQM